jgi:hypothetical protein
MANPNRKKDGAIKKLSEFAEKSCKAIHCIYPDHNLTIYSLILLYSTIDIMGYIVSEEKASGTRFKYFIDEFMSDALPNDITSVDLWGARCALLHTGTPESDLSKKGNARQILYSSGSAPIEILNQVICASEKPDKYIGISFEELLDAFICGIEEVYKIINKDTSFASMCLTKMETHYAFVSSNLSTKL